MFLLNNWKSNLHIDWTFSSISLHQKLSGIDSNWFRALTSILTKYQYAYQVSVYWYLYLIFEFPSTNTDTSYSKSVLEYWYCTALIFFLGSCILLNSYIFLPSLLFGHPYTFIRNQKKIPPTQSHIGLYCQTLLVVFQKFYLLYFYLDLSCNRNSIE